MDNLVQFLGDRYDEEHEDALRGYLKVPADPTHEGWDKATTAGLPPLVAARVLREVEAKRRIIARHASHSMGGCRNCERPHWGVPVCDHCERAAPCPDLRDLAVVHADHPGYRDDWRP